MEQPKFLVSSISFSVESFSLYIFHNENGNLLKDFRLLAISRCPYSLLSQVYAKCSLVSVINDKCRAKRCSVVSFCSPVVIILKSVITLAVSPSLCLELNRRFRLPVHLACLILFYDQAAPRFLGNFVSCQKKFKVLPKLLTFQNFS